MTYEIFQVFKDQATIPFIILAFFIVSYIIIIEKFILLQFVYRINFPKFNADIKRMLQNQDIDRVRSYCLATSRSGIPPIVAKAVELLSSDPSKVKASISEGALFFFPSIRRRLNQLPSLAAACILLGVLGAVHGVWFAFEIAESLEFGIKNFAFSQGVASALVPVVFSLVMGTSILIPFGILDAMAWRLEAESEHCLCIILNTLESQGIVTTPSAPMYEMPDLPASELDKAIAQEAQATPVRSPIEPAKTEASAKEKQEGVVNELNTAKIEKVPEEEEII